MCCFVNRVSFFLTFSRFRLCINEAADELNEHRKRENQELFMKRYLVEKGMKNGKIEKNIFRFGNPWVK